MSFHIASFMCQLWGLIKVITREKKHKSTPEEKNDSSCPYNLNNMHPPLIFPFPFD